MKMYEIVNFVSDVVFKICVVMGIVYLNLIVKELREDRADDVSIQLHLYYELRKKIERLENEFKEKFSKNKKGN